MGPACVSPYMALGILSYLVHTCKEAIHGKWRRSCLKTASLLTAPADVPPRGTSPAEAPGRAKSPFLLRLVHPFVGLKIVCTSNVARGAPWARHPPAGHERAPNCASTGRSRGCIARYICSREDDGAGGRCTGAFRGAHRRGCTCPIWAHCPALPSGQGRWGQGCLGMESFLHQTSAVCLHMVPLTPEKLSDRFK